MLMKLEFCLSISFLIHISLFDIPATTYNVTGLNIGASAQTVSINTTTFTITLSVANVGPVAGPVAGACAVAAALSTIFAG